MNLGDLGVDDKGSVVHRSKQQKPVVFLDPHRGICSDILSDIYFDILFAILSDIYADILCLINSDILSGIPSDIC